MNQVRHQVQEVVVHPCCMCGKEAKYSAKANYKAGVKEELLCEECARINQTIEQEKWRYKLK